MVYSFKTFEFGHWRYSWDNFFMAAPMAHGSSKPGIESELQLWPHHKYSNARYLTHYTKLGIVPTPPQQPKLLSQILFLYTVDLQCSVNFCYIVKWPSYTHIYILFHILSSIMVYPKRLDIVPVQQDLIVDPFYMDFFFFFFFSV